ncbi:MAG: WbqC family protein [Chlorobi bacterium]|nr:WbqC family protein [Chlorobiota bacterium]
MDKIIVLSTAYLPPIQYISKFIPDGKVLIEDDENYTKQTYRNRCLIAGPNGIQSLIVPVEKGSFHKTHIRDIRVDYQTRWVDMHKRAFDAAYSSSPFYEYYIDELTRVIENKPGFLLDLNTGLLELLLKLLSIDRPFSFTEKYIAHGDEKGFRDYRDRIHPKKSVADPLFSAIPYDQVFSEKYGFLPNLSVVDLLFNTGPDAGLYLEKCIKR